MQHADLIADRRRLKRSLSAWRVAAIALLAGGLVTILAYLGGPLGKASGAHIATLSFDEVIFDDERQLKLIEDIARDDNVKAVILLIDSPGGTVTGSEIIYGELAALAGEKPVVSVIRGIGTSGAYAIALAGERIFARQTSIVGSIGVIFQWAEVSDLMASLGVDVNAIKSAPLKAEPQPFEPASEEARQMIERLVAGSLDWFVDILAQNRSLSASRARTLADGAIYTGQEALGIGLIDEIGGADEARAWLVATKGLDADLPVEAWAYDATDEFDPLNFSLKAFAELFGLNIQSVRVSSSWGLMAIWYPRALEAGIN